MYHKFMQVNLGKPMFIEKHYFINLNRKFYTYISKQILFKIILKLIVQLSLPVFF